MKDGGPAFPTGVEIITGEGTEYRIQKGMTLADWFAGQALVGLISQADPPAIDCKTKEDFACWCFEMADAMLAEKERRGK